MGDGDLTPEQLQALGGSGGGTAVADPGALSDEQMKALGATPGKIGPAWGTPTTLPIPSSAIPGPFTAARKYFETVPETAPDKAGLRSQLSAAVNGDPDSAQYLNSMKFPDTWEAPRLAATDSTSNNLPLSMTQKAKQVAESYKNAFMQGGAEATGSMIQNFYKTQALVTGDRVDTNAFERDRRELAAQFPTDSGIAGTDAIKSVSNAAVGVIPYLTPATLPGAAVTGGGSVDYDAQQAGMAPWKAHTLGAVDAAANFVIPGAAGRFLEPALRTPFVKPVISNTVQGMAFPTVSAGAHAAVGDMQGAQEAIDSIPGSAAMGAGMGAAFHLPPGNLGPAMDAAGQRQDIANHFNLNAQQPVPSFKNALNAFAAQRDEAAKSAPPEVPIVAPTEASEAVSTPAVPPVVPSTGGKGTDNGTIPASPVDYAQGAASPVSATPASAPVPVQTKSVLDNVNDLYKSGTLLDQGPVPQDVVNRKVNIVRGQDIPYTAAATNDGLTAYFDKSYPDTIAHTKPDGTVDQYDPAPYTALHERVEQHLMETQGLDYAEAHQIATQYEHSALQRGGHDPEAYEAGLEPYIDEAGHRRSPPAPTDTFVGPYVESGEANLLGDTTHGPQPHVEGLQKPTDPPPLSPVSVVGADGERVDTERKLPPPAPAEAPGRPPEANAPAGMAKPTQSVPDTRGKKELPAPAAKGAPLQHGELKGRVAEKAFFGDKKDTPVPPVFQPTKARVFANAGHVAMHAMEIPNTGGVHLMVHPSGKVMLGKTTDAKGRANEDGVELRPIDKRGAPTTIPNEPTKFEGHAALTFDSIEEGAHYGARHFTQDEGAKAAVDTAPSEGLAATKLIKGNADLSDKDLQAKVDKYKDEYDQLMSDPDNLTPADHKRLDTVLEHLTQAHADLESRTAPVETKPVKAAEPEVEPGVDSPLTPAGRKELAEDIQPDMSPVNVGRFVTNHLETTLGRTPSNGEVRAALADLAKNGHITKEQAAAPLEKSMKLNSIFDPATALLGDAITKAGGAVSRLAREAVRNAMDDLPDIGHTIDQRALSKKPGSFGASSDAVVGFLARIGAPAWVGHAVGEAKMFLMARTVAALHDKFAPIYDRMTEAIDNKHQALHQLGGATHDLADLPSRSKERVNRAYVQFQLEGRKLEDYGKKFTFTDLAGRDHTHVLTDREQKVLTGLFDSTHKALTDYTDAMKYGLDIPRHMTASDVIVAIRKGALPESARAVVAPLEAMEAATENGVGYGPFTRFGGYKRMTVWDRELFNAANSSADIKAAQRAFITSESASDYRKQANDLRQKYPEETHVIHEYGDGPEEQSKQDRESVISERQFRDMSKAAGMSAQDVQAFLDGGLGDLMKRRGMGANFKARGMVDGMSMDISRVMANYLHKMTSATENFRANKDITAHMNKMTDASDSALKRYAEEFNLRATSTAPRLGATLTGLAITHYLGFNLYSAAKYTSQAAFYGPRNAMMFAKNPGQALASVAEAVGGIAKALAHAFGLPQLINTLQRAPVMDQAGWAVKRFAKSDPKLSEAVRNQAERGLFLDTNNRILNEMTQAAPGKVMSVTKQILAQSMRAFSAIDTSNRLSVFISGYKMWDGTAKSDPGWVARMRDQGFRGNTAEQYGKWFSEFHNGRFDQSERSKLFQGTFTKAKQSGELTFNPSSIQHMAGALRSWDMNAIQGSFLQYRAAMKGGWIDKARYSAAMAATMLMLGTGGSIVGMKAFDAAQHAWKGGLTTQEKLEQTTAGHIALHGVASPVGDALGAHRAGKYIEEALNSLGAGDVIPTGSPWDIAPPIGAGVGEVQSGIDLTSAQNSRQREDALAGMVGPGAQRLDRTAHMLSDTRGFTDKNGRTLVPDAAVAPPGVPAITGADKLLYGFGMTIPAVSEARKNLEEKYELKMTSAQFIDAWAPSVIAAAYDKDSSPEDKQAAIKALMQQVQDRNEQAQKTGDLSRMVLSDALRQALKIAAQDYQRGATPSLKSVPKQMRPELQRIEKANTR